MKCLLALLLVLLAPLAQADDARPNFVQITETEWTVPDAENRPAVTTEYPWLGIEHIWVGSITCYSWPVSCSSPERDASC